MTASQARRLVVLEGWRLRHRPPPIPTGFDSSELTMREQYELDRLLAPLAPVSAEDRMLGPLSDEQRARLDDLMSKAHGAGGPAVTA